MEQIFITHNILYDTLPNPEQSDVDLTLRGRIDESYTSIMTPPKREKVTKESSQGNFLHLCIITHAYSKKNYRKFII